LDPHQVMLWKANATEAAQFPEAEVDWSSVNRPNAHSLAMELLR
jgi:hypothetical protein